jgi:hypothetical protein
MGQGENGRACSQEQDEAVATGEEFDITSGLAEVRFKAQR